MGRLSCESYIATAKKSISATATALLLIRECSESSCTKCTEAEMESEKEKSPFYIRECGSDLPFCPILCGVEHSVSLRHLNYTQEYMRPLINSAYANVMGNMIQCLSQYGHRKATFTRILFQNYTGPDYMHIKRYGIKTLDNSHTSTPQKRLF